MVQRAGDRDRLAIAAEGGSSGEVAVQEPPRAQLGRGAGVPSRQRAALGLHVAEPAPGRAPREGPRHRGELAVHGEHGHRTAHGQAQPLVLHRLHRVLQGGVVELHHVRALGFPAA